MRVAREFRGMVKQLEKLGYRVVPGGHHGRLVTKEGRYVTSVPLNRSCPRAAKNWRAQLRQKGIDLQ